MAAATVVWLADGAGSAPVTPASPGEDARRALDAWARTRGVRLEPPSEEGPRAVAIDWSAGDAVEREIDRAREALAGLDYDAAERALAKAEALLRDHPELPQAAWLRAEVERAWSARWLRENDEPRAKRAWQRAATLDGGREPSLGEKAYDPAPPIMATIHLDGAGVLRLDGANIAPGEVKRGEGEHTLAITRPDGAITWAAWVSLAQGEVVRLTAPEAPACSREDVERARVEGDVVVAKGVRCERWVAALAGTGSVVRVATCEKGTCGPLVEWRSISSVASGWTFGPAVPPAEAHRWPAWATWTIAGLGVAGVAVAIVVAAEAAKSSPTETRFVNGGLQVHSF